MTKALRLYQNELPFCCGVSTLGDFDAVNLPTFNEKKPWAYHGYRKKPDWWEASNTEDAREEHECEVRRLLDIQLDADKNEIYSPTGMFVATFNQKQKVEYELACQRFTLLSQSPPRKSATTGNEIFVCVFEKKPPQSNLPKL